MRIKTGDTVVVISGKDRGKKGKIIAVKGDRVVVEGVNKVQKHTKPSQKKSSRRNYRTRSCNSPFKCNVV